MMNWIKDYYKDLLVSLVLCFSGLLVASALDADNKVMLIVIVVSAYIFTYLALEREFKTLASEIYKEEDSYIQNYLESYFEFKDSKKVWKYINKLRENKANFS